MPKRSTKLSMKTEALPPFEKGSGNVFADIGLPDPGTALAKARLALEISRLIRNQGMTQTEAGKKLGIDQPRVSALLRGRLEAFSLEKLMGFVARLGNVVELRFFPAQHATGAGIKVVPHKEPAFPYALLRATSDLLLPEESVSSMPEPWLAARLSDYTEVLQLG
jgi:predicted XRE-type DNA-binding protein